MASSGYYLPENSLEQVTIPILLFIAEQDQYTPRKWTADVILNGVPDKSKVTLKEVKNAGHFHSLVRFHNEKPNFLPSTDQTALEKYFIKSYR
jgi:pimeloyl-ACP methyl ester carboxylesterase